MPGGFENIVKVGVGVIVTKGDGTNRILVGKRLGSRGAGQWALPGGHLELGESFEDCARREVMEETGLQLEGAIDFQYALNSVFPDGAHYVTVFMRAEAGEGAVPEACEPDKCEGWEWVEWDALLALAGATFLPLAALLSSPFRLKR